MSSEALSRAESRGVLSGKWSDDSLGRSRSTSRFRSVVSVVGGGKSGAETSQGQGASTFVESRSTSCTFVGSSRSDVFRASSCRV